MKFLPLLLVLLTTSCAGLKNKIVKPPSNRKFFTRSWAKNFDPEYSTGNLPISFAYPNIHRDILFAGTSGGSFHALGLRTGNQLWKAKDKGGVVSSSGIYKENVLYGTEEGRIYSRNYLNGHKNFEVDVGDSVDTPPVFHQNRAFFHLRGHKIVCLDAVTGKFLWSYKHNLSLRTSVETVSLPTFFDNKLFIMRPLLVKIKN